jgi:hypothetical protein
MSQFSLLVQFGRSGFVGRFVACVPHGRGSRVVVRGPRGTEFGTVLCEPQSQFAPAMTTEGEVLREATDADCATASQFPAREAELLAVANNRAAERGLPITFIDAELTLDSCAILHGLAWDICDATPLFDELGTQFGLAVRWLDLSRTPVANDKPQHTEHASCGKPGCGTSGGGCSSCGTDNSGESKGCATGSCSRGKVKSADELTAYFADLRQKMETASTTRTPLV